MISMDALCLLNQVWLITITIMSSVGFLDVLKSIIRDDFPWVMNSNPGGKGMIAEASKNLLKLKSLATLVDLHFLLHQWSRKWARVVGLQTQSRDLSQLLRKGFDWMKLMRPLNEEKDHWVPDEAVRKCTACGTDFGAFVRRVSIYSNRFCLYCVDSPNNVVLPYGVFLKHSWIISYPLKPFFTL
ncbi:uncharacterized protein [Nicotiana tomentosiformis]|uniref:uncharacterized protein isoform X2 n=1 Tax=Nicotiana tomentosiformis TaxID=4098 RepID=UPI00144580E0|nr:uncharacterized protein LOC104112186 isoform X2 [Nicotiana tomentosiformis]